MILQRNPLIDQKPTTDKPVLRINSLLREGSVTCWIHGLSYETTCTHTNLLRVLHTELLFSRSDALLTNINKSNYKKKKKDIFFLFVSACVHRGLRRANGRTRTQMCFSKQRQIKYVETHRTTTFSLFHFFSDYNIGSLTSLN